MQGYNLPEMTTETPMPKCRPPKQEGNMIEDYFNSENKLHNRIFEILAVAEDFEFELGYFSQYSSYLIDDIQQTKDYLCVNLSYTEPFESYADTKRFIFPKDLFTEEFPEDKIISFWKEYIKKEETFESKRMLEQTLLGLSDNLLEELSDLRVDFSRLKEYPYRTEILNKLMEK